MVTFRYHVVTLIAVFLALAVGVVLGAGPLQKAVDRSSGGSGAAVADERVPVLEGQLRDADGFVWGLGDELLPGILDEERIAVVLLPGALDAGAVVQALNTSGAEITTTVRLTDLWVAPDQTSYRQTLAGAVSAHLETRPAGSSAEAALAQGVVEALTSSSAGAELVRSMLTDDDTPLVTTNAWGDPARAVILVGPQDQAAGQGQLADQGQSGPAYDGSAQHSQDPVFWEALADAAETTPGPSAAIGQAQSASQFISVVRAHTSALITVDGADSVAAAVNLALALADGSPGAYGQGQGATRAVAPLPGATSPANGTAVDSAEEETAQSE